MSPAKTRNLTILLTDLKGFTEKTSRKSRAEVLTMLEKHQETVLPVLEARGGQLVKTIGDAFLMTFESPTDAVLAGVEVQEALLIYNEGKTGDDRLDVRIAINVGEINITDNDIFGEPVNITARIEAIAEAGEVYFSEAVYLAMNKREVPTSEIGFRKLKGISEEIKLYKVKRENPVEELPAEDGSPAAAPISGSKQPPPPPGLTIPTPAGLTRRLFALGIDFAICLLIFGIFFEAQKPKKSRRHRQNKIAEKMHKKMDKVHKKISKEGFKVKIDGNTVKVGNVEITEDRVKVGDLVDINLSKKDAQEVKEVLKVGPVSITQEKLPKDRPKNEKAFPFLWFIYGTFFLTIWSATPGKRMLGLRVVSTELPASAPLDWKTAALRSGASIVSASCAMIGFAWAAFSKDKQTWHDLIAKTRVVRH